ncbi:unnamed protein product [Ilex paraguariensis]|uniref:Uncharacterized protein n=1 Tax=Ilex paraguariensis TaxID=185542 RepID=A0ABC8SKN9_9AQUA
MEENQNVSRGKLYDAVSARIGDQLQKLKAQVDRLATEQSLQSQSYPKCRAERAAGIFQRVDWETLGMNCFVGAEENSLPSRQDLPAELQMNLTNPQENDIPNQYSRMGFSYKGGIMSRIQGYMDPTELMGFAARGLFMNCRLKEGKFCKC